MVINSRVSLVPEDAEDIWHAYNLIHPGDTIRASTIRKVQTESATGSSSSNRVRTTLTIQAEDTDFDTHGAVLRVKGRNVEENQYVKMGAYHTIDIEANRKFMLYKTYWDTVSIERVEMACDPTQHADLAAVVMQEGIAHVCLVTSCMTLVRAKIDQPIPRKRKGHTSQHDKGLQKFFETVMQALLRHARLDVVKCVLVASPGFVKDQFAEYMWQTAFKTDNKQLLESKSKFLLVHASSGFKHSLKEVLQDPAVMARLSDTKAAGEVKALETFYRTLQDDPSKAYYGYKHVERANEAQAIETLLCSDKLFRSLDLSERKKYVALVDSVREYGGDVKIFSSLHISGEQLEQLTGVAAVLRYPMPEIESDDDEDEEGDD
ncbi:LOW QUALITY PROTEIN: protein pelota-like [Pollicipes pollicipes]|uniref:LOW QUALITY PROTEIN: protein pelota-like n=1 Tax=Pollicipes pollicipes TaxID=41117 RepID=UPI0018856FA5|nr:LOW QUALITY PROTEIN: protein pelota-like [Pollicipes pollicipes]